jgi:transcriptional regulator with GAF, ATPase, and Fis domain
LVEQTRESIATAERRSARLRALLDVTIAWNRHRNTDELLQQIAETSTRLLDAERATIFLVDQTRGLLVGKPALGVAGGELLVPLNSGIVGRTISSGEVHRVDADVASEQALVDRSVDQTLNFRTRSLVCAPIRNAAGKVVGAFELINKVISRRRMRLNWSNWPLMPASRLITPSESNCWSNQVVRQPRKRLGECKSSVNPPRWKKFASRLHAWQIPN